MSRTPSAGTATVLAGILCLLCVPRAIAQSDPMVWQEPDRMPPFREQVRGSAYENAAQRIVGVPRNIPLQLLDDEVPEIGSRVWWVDDSSRVRGRPFIEPGDIIFKAGDDFAMLGPHMIHPRAASRVFYYSIRDRRRRSMSVPPGGLRLFAGLHWLPHITYLTTNAIRSQRWDYDAVVGFTAFATDPEIAETGFHRAIRAGFSPRAMSLGVGAWMALRQGRPEVAADYAWLATKGRFADSKYTHPMVLYQTAIANYKMDVARELVEKHEGYFQIEPGAMQRVVDLHTSRSVAERTVPPPTTLAKAMYRDDLKPRLVTFPANMWKKQLEQIQAGKPVQMTVGTDRFALVNLGANGAINHFDITVEFVAGPADRRAAAFEREVMFAIRDLTATPRDMLDSFYSPNMLAVSFMEWPVAYLAHSNVNNWFGYVDPSTELDGKRKMKLRMVRVNGQAEVFVNDQRVLYCPVDESIRNVGLVIKAVGMKMTINSLDAVELIEQP